MKKMPHKTGFAITLAWPETLCKRPGSWYDQPANWSGISKNHYYKAGHAAIVLIDAQDGQCHYFDFGRYHAPFKHGRVRSQATDLELAIKTKTILTKDNGQILNIEEILSELQANPACHGDGALYAAYCKINFKLAFQKAIEMQCASPIPYGPFNPKGTNCSRFVNTIVRAGKPDKKYELLLKYRVPLTPTPMNNVQALPNFASAKSQRPLCNAKTLERQYLGQTLPAPLKHPSIPRNAQWLAGEGAGSWFYLQQTTSHYLITRFSPEGVTECKGLYMLEGNIAFDANLHYSFDHLSNCQWVTIKQHNIKFKLGLIVSFDPEKRWSELRKD